MRTFDQFMHLKVMEPRLLEAARLMMELEVNPEEYLQVLLENPSWQAGTQNLSGAASGMTQAGMQGLQGLGQAATGATSAAWDAGAAAANKVSQSALGQGVKNWWQDRFSADARIQKAASLIQKAVTDPVIVNLNGGNDKTILDKIITDLNAIAVRGKTARQAASGQPAGSAPAPSPAAAPSPAPVSPTAAP